MIANWLIKNFRTTYNHNAGYNIGLYMFMQNRDFAARKGTREKRRLKLKKKKVKTVVEQVGYVPHKRKKEIKAEVCPLNTIDESWKWKAIDNVYIIKYHPQPVYSLKEAIEYHRETHHPTMLNKPNAIVNAFIELNMRREKKNKYVDRFTKVIDTPHIFTSTENSRTVLAFSKNLQEQENAKNAGADYIGGVELIRKIQNGSFNFKEYDYVVAYADIVSDLLLIRGLLKRKFPNIKLGTLGNNMNQLVKKFKNGILYTAQPHKTFKEYGEINTTFGLLDMDIKELEENFSSLINDVESMRPKRDGSFIERVQIKSELSKESFKINYQEYLKTSNKEEIRKEEEEKEEEEQTAIIATH
ncbi:39S ribosomal protein L1, mitochondrial [Melipona quadrifasciata]|uniref:39S ribosomal protein L1, mitochondrial n=1 Tax=Melipona quadrifasciata TaxID=166423 RepID=A0A0M8ZZW9_9HYME|nr:39S ribosomal protein L1, mitochondrial [Melipona quadrifasciata]